LRMSLRNILKGLGMLTGVVLAACSGAPPNWPGMQVGDQTLYVADLDHVLAVDPQSGQERWRFPPKNGNAGACGGVYHAAPAVVAERVVIAAENPGTGESRLCGLDRESGARNGSIRRRNSRPWAPSSPA